MCRCRDDAKTWGLASAIDFDTWDDLDVRCSTFHLPLQSYLAPNPICSVVGEGNEEGA